MSDHPETERVSSFLPQFQGRKVDEETSVSVETGEASVRGLRMRFLLVQSTGCDVVAGRLRIDTRSDASEQSVTGRNTGESLPEVQKVEVGASAEAKWLTGTEVGPAVQNRNGNTARLTVNCGQSKLVGLMAKTKASSTTSTGRSRTVVDLRGGTAGEIEFTVPEGVIGGRPGHAATLRRSFVHQR